MSEHQDNKTKKKRKKAFIYPRKHQDNKTPTLSTIDRLRGVQCADHLDDALDVLCSITRSATMGHHHDVSRHATTHCIVRVIFFGKPLASLYAAADQWLPGLG